MRLSGSGNNIISLLSSAVLSICLCTTCLVQLSGSLQT